MSEHRLGSKGLFLRPKEGTIAPKRVVFLSVEGTSTECDYFKNLEYYKEQLGIDALVHVKVLKKQDTNSDPESVYKLLEEYIQLRTSGEFEEELSTLELRSYDSDFIRKYLEEPSALSKREVRKFEAVLREERYDLLYLYFLSKFHGEEDRFGIVIDRDQKSHPAVTMGNIREKCSQKGYLCYISNPCFEFWLLLHVCDVKTEYAAQLDQLLENPLAENGHTFVSNELQQKTGKRKKIQRKTFEDFYLPNIDTAIERSKGFSPEENLLEEVGSNLWKLFDVLRKNPAVL